MKEITFKCETITPMFLAGADGKTPELRAPSFKGAIRFWWRAMHGNLDLRELKRRESEIFGGSGENETKSKLIIRVNGKTTVEGFSKINMKIIPVKYGKNYINVNLGKYLGLGMFRTGHGNNVSPDHEYIKPNSKFNITLRFPEEYEKEIIDTILALELFGNIGAKSRNGFGGFKITNWNELGYRNIDKLPIEFIKHIELNSTLPKYLAFSREMKIFNGEKQKSWEDALSLIGEAYLKSRISIDQLHNYDKRKYIAFPVNVPSDNTINHIINNKDRHAKPYFFKVLNENNHFVPYIFYFPSEYVFGINNLNGYSNIDETKQTKNFIEACSSLNKQLLQNGFKEVNNA